MHVVLVEPSFPLNQREFARALHDVGATVTGIGERPKDSLDEGLRRWLTHFQQGLNDCDERAMIEKVRRPQSMGPGPRPGPTPSPPGVGARPAAFLAPRSRPRFSAAINRR